MAEAEGECIPHAGKLRALVLAPTRELALQVSAWANRIQEDTKIELQEAATCEVALQVSAWANRIQDALRDLSRASRGLLKSPHQNVARDLFLLLLSAKAMLTCCLWIKASILSGLTMLHCWLQVSTHLAAVGKVARVRVAAIVGGLAHVKQERLLRAAPPVIVATPGRLWELMREGHRWEHGDGVVERCDVAGHFQVGCAGGWVDRCVAGGQPQVGCAVGCGGEV